MLFIDNKFENIDRCLEHPAHWSYMSLFNRRLYAHDKGYFQLRV